MPAKVNSVLVVGAGIGGIKAACDLAQLGFDVHLVESAPNIGGKLQQHDRWFPTDDCTMCQSLPYPAAPGAQEFCLRRVLAFPGVTIHAYALLESLSGKPGNYQVKVREKSRMIRQELCTACDKCTQVCPVEVPDAFQGGLATRKAAYILYPGAYPSTYTIDSDACTRCGECVKACPTNAIDLDMADETVELTVGAVILAPGFEEFDPALLPSYGYERFKNVITSTEFERTTAGGGITPGVLTRPSDTETPSSVAFLTCVGSRDTERPYCSYACCMYTLKEAILAKELHPEIEVCIFYMDMRAFGKQWWRYYEKARNLGVSFVRCRIASVEDGGAGDLKINYEDESGAYFSNIFGMVVLATGQVQGESSRKLAQAAGVELDQWGFCKTDEFYPIRTGKDGIFAVGSFAAPADIAATVTQAQAGALEAAALLWKARKPVAPPKLRKPDEPETALFLAGENAMQLVESVPEHIAPKHLETVDASCPSAIIAAVSKKLGELESVDRLIVAAPLSWSWRALLVQQVESLGLAANKIEVVDTRIAGPESLARMVAAALSRIGYAAEAPSELAEVTPAALVIGGGVSALTSAQALSSLGFTVHVVNREKKFGGQAQEIHTSEHGQSVDKFLKKLVSVVKKDKKKIHLYPESTLSTVAGSAGRFVSVIETPDGPMEIAHGATIIATGASEYDFSGDGYPKGVITQREFEKQLLKGKKKPASVVMIQCVGTLNEEHPYCSRTCCIKALKNALALKKTNPEAEVFILSREVMTYGLHELAYKEAREAGVVFLRYQQDRPPAVSKKGKSFSVYVYDPLLEEEIALPADQVVLSTGTVCVDAAAVARATGVEIDEFGFFKEANPKFRPVETDRPGVFICGLAQGPQSLEESITQAQAAAVRAAAILSNKSLLTGSMTSTVANRWCVGCELCVTVCPVHARVIDVKTKKAKVYSELCVACGACATVCPSSAAKSTAANDKQLLASIEILSLE